jgi:hypothetical protein
MNAVQTQQQSSNNVWGGLLVTGRPSRLGTSAEAITTEISFHMICWTSNYIPLAVRTRTWYMHDRVPAHYILIARYVLKNTYHGQRWIHCMASTLVRDESSGFLPVGTRKNPCVCSSCRHLKGTSISHCGCPPDYPQLPRHLWTDAAVHEACIESHGGHWNTYCKCTLSVISHQLYDSGHMFKWTSFLVFICGIRA